MRELFFEPGRLPLGEVSGFEFGTAPGHGDADVAILSEPQHITAGARMAHKAQRKIPAGDGERIPRDAVARMQKEFELHGAIKGSKDASGNSTFGLGLAHDPGMGYKYWMRRRLPRIVPLVLLAIFLCFALFLVFERIRGKISLAVYKKLMVLRGDMLPPRGPEPGPGANGAPQVQAAVAQIKKGDTFPEHWPPGAYLTASGHGITWARESRWMDGKNGDDWEALRKELSSNEPALEQIKEGLLKPVLNNNLDWSDAPRTSFTHLIAPKTVVVIFQAEELLALHEGKASDALDALLFQLRAINLVAEDRIVISELVRRACAAIAVRSTWEALQTDIWSDAELNTLQEAWNSLSFATNLADAFRGEIAFGGKCFDAAARSNDDAMACVFPLDAFLGDDDRSTWERGVVRMPLGKSLVDFSKQQVYCRIWRFAWLEQQERQYFVELHRLIKLTRHAAAQHSYAAVERELRDLEQEPAKRGVYNRLRFPQANSVTTLAHAVRQAMRMETERSMAMCAIALKRFFLRRHRFPAALKELVPEFVRSVPLDYMDGKPLKYGRDEDGADFTLYSVGQNLTDDGGDAEMLPGNVGQGSQWNRKDVVWPRVASPEEVETVRREHDRNSKRGGY